MDRRPADTDDAALEALHETQSIDGRVWPSYGRYGVANVPDTAAALLAIEADRPLTEDPLGRLVDAAIEHVLLLVIDGLGYRRFTELRETVPRLDRLARRAGVLPLTSTYPSETAAAMTTLLTGLQPAEHGLIGWFTRFERPTVIGHSLPFRTLEGEPLDQAFGVDPGRLLETDRRRTVPETLTEAGVAVTYVLPEQIADSHASRLTAGPADRRAYEKLTTALDDAAASVNAASGPTYHLVYDPTADAQGHHHGTRSSAYRTAVERAVDALYDRFIAGVNDHIADRTAVLVVADHGQVNTEPASNIDLAALEAAGTIELSPHLEVGPAGAPLYLAGGPRNLQLHLKPGGIEPARRGLEEALDALVLDQPAIETRGLFGDRTSGSLFGLRSPDLLVVPDHGSIWYDDGELDHVGMHGGMDPAEMVVPLAAGLASEL